MEYALATENGLYFINIIKLANAKFELSEVMKKDSPLKQNTKGTNNDQSEVLLKGTTLLAIFEY
jgi:hypothetical protein